MTALKYYNPNSPCVSENLKAFIQQHYPHHQQDANHLKVTNFIIEKVNAFQHHDLEALIIQAASFRHFLG